MLLWTLRVYISSWISVLGIVLDVYPGMELFSHMVVPFFSFLRNLHTVCYLSFLHSSRHLSCVFQETNPYLCSLSLLYCILFLQFFLQSLAPVAWSPAEREREQKQWVSWLTFQDPAAWAVQGWQCSALSLGVSQPNATQHKHWMTFSELLIFHQKWSLFL